MSDSNKEYDLTFYFFNPYYNKEYSLAWQLNYQDLENLFISLNNFFGVKKAEEINSKDLEHLIPNCPVCKQIINYYEDILDEQDKIIEEKK